MSDTLPPLNWLRVFEASARHLSFTNAAAELHITQSAVSQQIRALETYFGRPLFRRRPRILELTEAGRDLLPVVQDAFSRLNAGTRALSGADIGRRVNVQSNLSFSVFWLAPRLAQLLKRHPWLDLHIMPVNWDIERSRAGDFIEIRFGHGLEIENLTRLAFDICYPVCKTNLADPQMDWREAPLFDCRGIIANWEVWLAEQSLRMPPGKSIHWATTYAVSLSAAMSGAGMAMAPHTIASYGLENGLLARPYSYAVTMDQAYYLQKPAARMETPAIRAFIEWILEEFGLQQTLAGEGVALP